MNKTLLKRISEVEKKLRAETIVPEWRKKSEQISVLLEMMEVFRKKREMEEANLTPEERAAKRKFEAQEENKYFLEERQSNAYRYVPKVWDPVRKGWYLPPEEEQMLNKEIEETVEKDREWLDSEERRQFDIEYAEYTEKQKAAKTEPT